MVYEVKKPILGFEDVLEVELRQLDKIFAHMVATDEDFPSFTLINPYALKDYIFDIPRDVRVLLDIKPNSKILVYNMVVLNSPITKSVVNFKAPLLFNQDNQTMAQFILKNEGLLTIEECLMHRNIETKKVAKIG